MHVSMGRAQALHEDSHANTIQPHANTIHPPAPSPHAPTHYQHYMQHATSCIYVYTNLLTARQAADLLVC